MSQATHASSALPSSERRGHVRFPCSQAAFCRAHQPRDYIFWTARARDISVEGIRLVLDHRFDPGTVVAVELLSAHQNLARALAAHVIYATAHGEGVWTIGCKFVHRLSETELVALL